MAEPSVLINSVLVQVVPRLKLLQNFDAFTRFAEELHNAIHGVAKGSKHLELIL